MFSGTSYSLKHLLRTFLVLGSIFGSGVNTFKKIHMTWTHRLHTFQWEETINK